MIINRGHSFPELLLKPTINAAMEKQHQFFYSPKICLVIVCFPHLIKDIFGILYYRQFSIFVLQAFCRVFMTDWLDSFLLLCPALFSIIILVIFGSDRTAAQGVTMYVGPSIRPSVWHKNVKSTQSSWPGEGWPLCQASSPSRRYRRQSRRRRRRSRAASPCRRLISTASLVYNVHVFRNICIFGRKNLTLMNNLNLHHI